MALSTFTQIYQRVRQRLGDDEVVGGQVFTDAYLGTLMPDNWANVIGAFSKFGLPYTEAESFVLVQPFQSYIDVQRSGLPNPGAILEVWLGTPDFVSSIPLSPAPTTDPTTGFVRIQPTSTTGLANGNEVMILGDPRFLGVVNDVWTVSVAGGVVTLNGCFATIRNPADYAGATPGNIVNVTPTSWRQLTYLQDYDPGTRNMQADRPSHYTYRKQAIRLVPDPQTQQVLSVTYRITGDSTFVSSDSPVIADDVSRILTPYLAGVACQAKGQPGYEDFYVEAFGKPTPVPDGEGGILGEYIALKLKELQLNPLQKSRFRVKNTTLRLGRGWLPGGRPVIPLA